MAGLESLSLHLLLETKDQLAAGDHYSVPISHELEIKDLSEKSVKSWDWTFRSNSMLWEMFSWVQTLLIWSPPSRQHRGGEQRTDNKAAARWRAWTGGADSSHELPRKWSQSKRTIQSCLLPHFSHFCVYNLANAASICMCSPFKPSTGGESHISPLQFFQCLITLSG